MSPLLGSRGLSSQPLCDSPGMLALPSPLEFGWAPQNKKHELPPRPARSSHLPSLARGARALSLLPCLVRSGPWPPPCCLARDVPQEVREQETGFLGVIVGYGCVLGVIAVNTVPGGYKQ